MADTTTTERELLIDYLFMDGDTRRQILKNPKDTITAQEITTLDTLILNGGTSTILLGDRSQSPFRRINTVTRRYTTTVDIDLN